MNKRLRTENDETSNIDITHKDSKMIFLRNKYFEKIKIAITKAQSKEKTSAHFYYNYYDFVNKKIAKPLDLLMEFLYEMSYVYSKYVYKDLASNEAITFRTIFGNNFRWQLRGKNLIIFEW